MRVLMKTQEKFITVKLWFMGDKIGKKNRKY